MTSTNKMILAAVFFFAIAGYWYFNVDQTTPTQGQGEPLVAVRVPALSGVAAAGKILFDENCATCHGANAAGQAGVAPPLVHKIYEPSHHGDGSFLLAAQQGTRAHHWPFGDMPPVEGISRDDVVKIIAYVRALQRENGIF